MAFFFGNYLNNLSKSQDIKWEQEETECLNYPTCDVGKLIFYIYRLGDSKKNVKLIFGVDGEDGYEVVGGSVQRYEVSIFNPTTKYKAEGRLETLPKGDPERSNQTTFEYNIDELSADQIYEMTVIVKDNNNKSLKNFGRFLVRDADNTKYTAKGLTRSDYIRLYLTEVVVTAVILALIVGAVLAILIWKGLTFFKPLFGWLSFRRRTV